MDTNESPDRSVNAIFELYGGFIRAVIRAQASQKLDVEDLFQEFFLILACKPIPADMRNIKGYLYRAIVHHVVDAARFQDAYDRAINKYAREIRISINNRGSGNAFTGEASKNAVIALLARYLRGREGEAFLLKYRDDCAIHEIATRMGINKRTVSRYLSESVRKLQRRLATE